MYRRVNRTARRARGALPWVCLLLAYLSPAVRADEPPQMVLIHGRIITVDPQDSIVEALAVRDGKIIAIGSDRDILRLAGRTTRRIDLHGRTATPGLIDSHAHIAEAGVGELYHVHLSDVSTVAEAVRRVRAAVAAAKPGEWVQGEGWDEGKLAERRYLLAADLDAVSPANPVWLTHTTGHYGVANSLALRLAKIEGRHARSDRRHHRSRRRRRADRRAQGGGAGRRGRFDPTADRRAAARRHSAECRRSASRGA